MNIADGDIPDVAPFRHRRGSASNAISDAVEALATPGGRA